MISRAVHKALFAFAKFLSPKVEESQIAVNRKVNSTLEPAPLRPITNQSKYKNIGFGDGNVGKHGCEAVAVFNILLIMGKPRPLADIISDFQERHILINKGRWGANPFDLDELMREYGLFVEEVKSPEEAHARMKDGDILFPTVWNKKNNPLRGIHGYIVLRKNSQDYWIFNKNYRDVPERAASLKEALAGGRYVVGYLIRNTEEE